MSAEPPTTPQNQLVKQNTPDYVASAAKAVLGAVPFVGSLLAEIAGSVIPNQRVDRIAKLAQELEAKLDKIDHDLVRSKLTDENFTDLVEEGLRQAARSLSDERRAYIASIIANGIKSGDVQFHESKHLLRILSELNDIEVIWLRFYLVRGFGGDEEFRARHKDILQPVRAYIRAPQEILDKSALQQSYKEHLMQLGLIEAEYDIDVRTKQPNFDTSTGGLKVRAHRLTLLGRLLLKQIGLADEAGRKATNATSSLT